MFRTVIIGPGSIAATYAEALKDSQAVKITAVLGIEEDSTQKFAQKYNINYYTDSDLMYKTEQPDSVIICTPTFTHFEIVKTAVANGVHIMCEKPFTLNADKASELFSLAEQNNVRIMVMQVVRFWPEYAKIKELKDSGKLGDIKNVYLSRLSSHPKWCNWHKDPEKSGGGLYDLHIHDIDYLYYLFGKVKSVFAVGKQENTGCYNNVSTTLVFENGITAVAEGFMDITGDWQFCTNVRINGSKAAVEYINKQGLNNFTLYPAGETMQRVEFEKYNPYKAETEYFAKCVEENIPIEAVPNSDVVDVLRIIDAIEKSLKSGTIQNIF